MTVHLKVERVPLTHPAHSEPLCGSVDGGMTARIAGVTCGYCLNRAQYDLHIDVSAALTESR